MESKKVKTLEEYVLNELYQVKEDLENERNANKIFRTTNNAIADTLENLYDTLRLALHHSKVVRDNGITSVYVQGTYINCYSVWDIEQKEPKALELQALADLIEKVNSLKVEREEK